MFINWLISPQCQFSKPGKTCSSAFPPGDRGGSKQASLRDKLTLGFQFPGYFIVALLQLLDLVVELLVGGFLVGTDITQLDVVLNKAVFQCLDFLIRKLLRVAQILDRIAVVTQKVNSCLSLVLLS